MSSPGQEAHPLCSVLFSQMWLFDHKMIQSLRLNTPQLTSATKTAKHSVFKNLSIFGELNCIMSVASKHFSRLHPDTTRLMDSHWVILRVTEKENKSARVLCPLPAACSLDDSSSSFIWLELHLINEFTSPFPCGSHHLMLTVTCSTSCFLRQCGCLMNTQCCLATTQSILLALHGSPLCLSPTSNLDLWSSSFLFILNF